jgi:hypothetical protein
MNQAPDRDTRRSGGRGRLGLLLACLGVLVVYVIASRAGILSQRAGAGCPSESPQQVRSVSAADLPELRASVAKVLPHRIGRLYEEGTITSANAWSDNSPSPLRLSSSNSRPAGYEMRWWAPSRDDVVADVFLFAGAAEAREFLGQAAATRCRPSGRRAAASWPGEALNLLWVNPDGFTQEDVLFSSGARVYRVGEVLAGRSGHRPTRRELRRAFFTVDTLACLLPGARCLLARGSVPV